MDINELMEKLPFGYVISRVGEKIYYYHNTADYYSKKPQFTKGSNETFTQFIQRIVENE
jgi:hypothetical protein